MLRQASSTPCPIPAHPHHHRQPRQDSIYSTTGDDSTANIEFTSAIPNLGGGAAGLRNAKPRRRLAAAGKALGFAIHEDEEVPSHAGGPELMKAVADRRDGNKVAILQPPQRPKGSVNFAPGASASTVFAGPADEVRSRPKADPSKMPDKTGTSRRLSQAPKRPILKPDAAQVVAEPLPALPEDTVAFPPMEPTIMLKPARRGTIYIPSEDTTMPSMYMGIFSPIKDLDAAKTASTSVPAAEGSAETNIEFTGIAAQMIAKKQRAARKSMITMSPKRGPLQVTSRNMQESAVLEDRWGQGGGKENVPPGHCEVVDRKVKSGKRMSTLDGEPVRRRAQQQASAEARISKLFEPTASSRARVDDKKTTQRASTKLSWNAGPRLKTSQPVLVRPEIIEPKSSIVDECQVRKPSVPTRFVMPRVDTQPVSKVYPVLTEDLPNLSMYEDNWLNHQEIAITQLTNNLFGASAPTRSPVEVEMLRIRLLERYGKADNVMLYKRLQAALLYGALSVPSETLKGATRLSSDLGKRKAFTDFWLETYDLSCLQSALEVVAGRQCTNPSIASPSIRRSVDNGQGVSRRALQGFIETFLIRNEDGTPDGSSTDPFAWFYQRTLLRSLMLIKLLDSTKASQGQFLSTCLFQSSSQYKSSVSVLRALFQLLNPSAGDPTRALSHIGYTVTHAQYPLEEYRYKMENIAVDLRDGVRLTRLVELLLYPSASPSLDHDHDANSTTTVLLPTGELLSLTEGERDWPLSQHLKFPCHGRATKLYNVQIALSALQRVKGMTAVVQDIKAEDIVDGYREKTVKLLWGLTSKWGLSGLIDWNDVEREIKSLCRTGCTGHDNDFFDIVEDEDGYARHKMLLKSWAQAIASKKGIVVKNLTTGFADGRVFEAIVDEYQGYLSCDIESSKRRPLCERLRGLGCSEQFVVLFSTSEALPNRTHLFDRDFVLAALAFLCSRLLSPTQGVRAAVTIQKAWRSYWERVLDSRKAHLKAVAKSCAQDVGNRKQMIEAKNREYGLHEGSSAAIGDEAELGRNGKGIASPTTTEEEDIWLSLER